MPSTPRMQEIERCASSPGEPLTQAEVSEWHKMNTRAGHLEKLAEIDAPMIAEGIFRLAPNRYLDSTRYKGHV